MSRRRRKLAPTENISADSSDPLAPQPPVTASPTEPPASIEASAAGAKPALFPKLPSLSRIMSVVMLVIGIFAVGVLFYRVMAGFFVPLFLAALLVVIFRPVHDWLLARSGRRRRLAALGTTLLIFLIVLLPFLLVVSVAASQFTAMLSQVNFNNATEAIDRVRERFSLSLPHAEYFRRLDELADSFEDSDDPETVKRNIAEAILLIRYLQDHVEGPEAAEPAAAMAQANLEEFAEELQRQQDSVEAVPGSLLRIDSKDRLDQQAVIAGASIRAWMHTLLGGTVRSQLRLIANPSEADFANLVRQSRESLQPRFIQLTSATGGLAVQLLFGLVILVLAFYFFLIDGPAMIRTLMRLSPLDDQYERQLLTEFDRTSRAVVLASALSALAQGVLAAIGFYFAGLDSIVLLFLLTSLLALVPFLGAASVWIPCALWLGAVEQRWTAAIVLSIYGLTVISSIDNVVKVYVLHGRSQLHPLFALLSVLGGVRVFGPIGILVGPMVVVFLQTLLEILNHELEATSLRSKAKL